MASVTVTPAGYAQPLTFYRNAANVFDDPGGVVATALTSAGCTLRTLVTVTAGGGPVPGAGGCGNRDTMGENVGVSNASP